MPKNLTNLDVFVCLRNVYSLEFNARILSMTLVIKMGGQTWERKVLHCKMSSSKCSTWTDIDWMVIRIKRREWLEQAAEMESDKRRWIFVEVKYIGLKDELKPYGITLWYKQRLIKTIWLEKRVLDKMRSNKRRTGLLIDGKKKEPSDLPYLDGDYDFDLIPCFSILQRFLSNEGSSLETLENYSLHFGITQTFPIISLRSQQCLRTTLFYFM